VTSNYICCPANEKAVVLPLKEFAAEWLFETGPDFVRF
jgi:hypothetical protein